MISTYHYKPHFYFTLVFVSTFLLWFAGAYLSFTPAGRDVYMVPLLGGLIAPFVIAVSLIFTSGNSALKKDALNRIFNPALIRVKMLPILVLLMPLAVLLSISISLFLGGSASQFKLAEGFSFSTGFVPVLLLLLLAATFEELGWRGYAFDSLQSRYTVFKATIIFSILWSLWHLPLMLVKDSYQYEILRQNVWYAVNFYLGIIPLGVIVSWICLKNSKSILAAILFHFIINIANEMFDITQMTKSIETGVLAIISVVIIVMDKKLFFSVAHLSERTVS
ncbi:CPBP family intramembrane metalloprotease [candidate division KSB1 bacterium]|nr:CPBP family intramembrane metalloprotease [candidate division KSB1 bacterium]